MTNIPFHTVTRHDITLNAKDIQDYTNGWLVLKSSASSWDPAVWTASKGLILSVTFNGKAVRMQILAVDLEGRRLKVREV